MHLVLSPTWLTKTTSPDNLTLRSLWIHKSVCFYGSGVTYLQEYDPPRRVTYFCNFFTNTCTSGQRNDGYEKEKNLDCPTESSKELCAINDDKVLTRDIMNGVGMETPVTLALRYHNTRQLKSVLTKIQTLDFDDISTLNETSLHNEITQFCDRLYNNGIQKIVVKPSGPPYFGSVGVSYHSVTDVESVYEAAKDLVGQIDVGCSVLVEEFIETISTESEPGDTINVIPYEWTADGNLGIRCRATVCRDHDDTPVTTTIICNPGDKTRPINGDCSVHQDLDTSLKAFRIMDEHVRLTLDNDIRIQASGVLGEIIQREKIMTPVERGGYRAQTDVIGIDIVITKRDGRLVPVAVEMNAHDCTINTQLYDAMLNMYQSMLPPIVKAKWESGRKLIPDTTNKGIDTQHILPTSTNKLVSNQGLTNTEGSDIDIFNSSADTQQRVCIGIKSDGHPAIQTIYHAVSNTSSNETFFVNDKSNCLFKTLDLCSLKKTDIVNNSPNLQEEIFTSTQLKLQDSRYRTGDLMGQSVRPLVRNIAARSQRFLIGGKVIVVIGAGGVSKVKIWPAAQQYDIKVILIDPDPKCVNVNVLHQLLVYEFTDHSRDDVHAANIMNMLRGYDIDGCVTFWEDCVPLTALVNERLGTRGIKPSAAMNAKVKSRTQATLLTKGSDIPHWPRTLLYAGRSHHIETLDDFANFSECMEFPAIMKLEHGSSAVGVRVVETKGEAIDHFERVSAKLRTEDDFPGIGLSHGNSMLAMEYFVGSEHDIDVCIYDRKLVAAYLSDNGPTNLPYFTETVATMPSTLCTDQQAQLVVAAYQCCTEIGLSDGVFNVEMKMTSRGPKLIEINARMGGFYLRDWILRVYGVDMALLSFLVAAGIKPSVGKHAGGEQLMGVMLVPSQHQHVIKNQEFIDKRQDLVATDQIKYAEMADHKINPPTNISVATTGNDIPNSAVFTQVDFEEPFAHVTVSGSDVTDAKHKLMNVCEQLGIDRNHYQVATFIEHF